MSEVLLDVRNLKKYFPTGDKARPVKAVDDISFQIFTGETLGVVGESGCGKSTTGRLALNLMQPTSGEVLFKGQRLDGMHGRQMREMRRRMQTIFQDRPGVFDIRKPGPHHAVSAAPSFVSQVAKEEIVFLNA